MGTPPQELSLRIDIAQPYVWTRSRQSLPVCANGQTPNNTFECDSGIGAFNQSASSSYYDENNWQRLIFLDYVWVNGTMSQDTLAFDQAFNVDINGSETRNLTVNEINFINANDSRVPMGGLGLSSKFDDSNNDYNTNFLDILKDQHVINSSSFSLYHKDDSSADLMLGGVNQDYYVGDFVVFDKQPYWDNRENKLVNDYPILPLSSLMVSNARGQTAYISTSNNTEPVLIDTRSSYNYLPYSMVVALAVQLNAFYSNDIDVWLLKCSITNLNATIGFQFGNVTVNVPIDEMINPAYTSSGNETLVFDDGEEACLLLVTPNYYFGYSVLGSPFFKSAYIAVDNEANKIAIAQAAKGNHTREQSSTTTDFAASAISSGHIPFASPNNITQLYTMRFDQSSIKSSAQPDMVTVSITNGEVFTGRVQPSNSSSMSSSASGGGVQLNNHYNNGNSVLGYVFSFITVVGLGILL
ncbi:hypothetical protein WICANDRAFT_90671 [Wickerhamomyces anomalus NRRL Y-366-8]|uniref:Peptidase A1 domain-containing protein n=1 Tax=Wickerhamomyces anomalus (strain ATCC 58044 / CBS 1984 / NCYC 433 / NRRL Y-366-8) TaxID=683960 RepID=A0A1E3P7B9_WICAA|nr:uncharacterized protein WICANDRAFT_90671 [Wickerhamomyces anomalus NRRL Y-366-8]ODQ61283.1 hypothetical protein WICANDRAFT_90671 [Wickerhamomyces anomalus NRRL Y-366-8]